MEVLGDIFGGLIDAFLSHGGRNVAGDLLSGAADMFIGEGRILGRFGAFTVEAMVDFAENIVINEALNRTFGRRAPHEGEHYKTFNSSAEPTPERAIAETASHHATMLRELKKHGAHIPEGEAESLLTRYNAALEAHLNGAEFNPKTLKDTYKKLTQVHHPDKGAQTNDIKTIKEALFHQVKTAYEHIKEPNNTAIFEQAADKDPKIIRDMIDHMAHHDFEGMLHKVENAAHLRLEGHAKPPPSKLSQFLAQCSSNEKAGLIFASIASVGLGAYGLAKIAEKHKEKSRTTEKDALQTWAQKIEPDTHTTTAHTAAR